MEWVSGHLRQISVTTKEKGKGELWTELQDSELAYHWGGSGLHPSAKHTHTGGLGKTPQGLACSSLFSWWLANSAHAVFNRSKEAPFRTPGLLRFFPSLPGKLFLPD